MVSQHNMIQYPNSQKLSALFQPDRQRPVIGRRLRIPGRVVMDKEDCRRRIAHCRNKSLPRVNQRHRERPFRDPDGILETVFLIEEDGPERFPSFVPQAGSQKIVDIPRGTDKGPFGTGLASDTSPQFEGRVDLTRFGKPHSGKPGKVRKCGTGNPSKAPVLCQETMSLGHGRLTPTSRSQQNSQ